MTASSAPELSPRARQIVDVARELLEQEGPDGLSMRNIAGRLGIRAPSLYKHLPDKQALEAALISDGFTEQAELFEQAAASADDPLAALAAAYREFATRHPNLYRLMYDQPLARELLRAGVEERAARPIIEALGGDGDAARAAFAFAHGMVSLELNDRFPPGADIDGAWRRGITALGTRHA